MIKSVKNSKWYNALQKALLLLVAPLVIHAQTPTNVTVFQAKKLPQGMGISWSTNGNNFSYTVQSADHLSLPLWINAHWSQSWPISSNSWVAPFEPGVSSRFYRVVQVEKANRGKLVQSVFLGSFSQIQLQFLASMQGIPFTPAYGVNYYRLLYETIDPMGGKIQASGLLCLPSGHTQPKKLLNYQHGTLIKKTDAPSANPSGGEGMIGVLFASIGYVATVPDYLGLGSSTGVHPYHHAVSEATAAVDMLRATRTYCVSNSITLTNRLFLMGYSQGGHACMALHRELERHHSAEFPVTASAPMAGAYDLSGTTAADFLSGRIMPNPYYFAYLLSSYQQVYRLANSLSDLLAPPYNTTLPPLLDGTHGGSEINAAMPADAAQILKPELLSAFRNNPNHPLRQALRDNDLLGWSPVAPMRLYHCKGDMDVAFGNSQAAAASFYQSGVFVPLIDPNSAADHGDCVMPSMLLAKQWFDTYQ